MNKEQQVNFDRIMINCHLPTRLDMTKLIRKIEEDKEKEMLDKFKEIIDEEIVVCDICKKYPENNCRHPCCNNNKKLKNRLSKDKLGETGK